MHSAPIGSVRSPKFTKTSQPVPSPVHASPAPPAAQTSPAAAAAAWQPRPAKLSGHRIVDIGMIDEWVQGHSTCADCVAAEVRAFARAQVNAFAKFLVKKGVRTAEKHASTFLSNMARDTLPPDFQGCGLHVVGEELGGFATRLSYRCKCKDHGVKKMETSRQLVVKRRVGKNQRLMPCVYREVNFRMAMGLMNIGRGPSHAAHLAAFLDMPVCRTSFPKAYKAAMKTIGPHYEQHQARDHVAVK